MENFQSRLLDISSQADIKTIAPGSLDTIICLNVLEHIEDDQEVLNGFNTLLSVGGHAIVLVPQHQWLYCGIDDSVGHKRRYKGSEELAEKLRKAGFEIAHAQNFNKLAVFGWFVSGKILGRRDLSPNQMGLFNLLMPVAKIVEHIPGLPSISTIVVGKKVGSVANTQTVDESLTVASKSDK